MVLPEYRKGVIDTIYADFRTPASDAGISQILGRMKSLRYAGVAGAGRSYDGPPAAADVGCLRRDVEYMEKDLSKKMEELKRLLEEIREARDMRQGSYVMKEVQRVERERIREVVLQAGPRPAPRDAERQEKMRKVYMYN